MKSTPLIESIKLGRKKLALGYPVLGTKYNKNVQENFKKELGFVMVNMKLSRAIMQLRHLNPEMYRLVNHLWKNEIAKHNLFKFRFTLTYVIRYLEEYLTMCENRYQQLS